MGEDVGKSKADLKPTLFYHFKVNFSDSSTITLYSNNESVHLISLQFHECLQDKHAHVKRPISINRIVPALQEILFLPPSSHYLSLPIWVTTVMVSKMYNFACIHVIKMKSYNMHFFTIYFFLFCLLCLWNSSMLLRAMVCSFLLLYSNPLCVYNTFYVSNLFELFPAFGYYKQHCYEHYCTSFLVNMCTYFFGVCSQKCGYQTIGCAYDPVF